MGYDFLQEPTHGKAGSSGKVVGTRRCCSRSRFESHFMVAVNTMAEQWQCMEPQYTRDLTNRIGLHPALFM